MKLRYTGVLAALIFAATALVACGSSGNSADENQISDTIAKAATSGDPAVCTKYQTANFNAQTNGGGGDPTQACEKDAASTAADTVDVSNVSVDGDKATADVAATGSILDGQTITVGLVKDGSQWKLDSVDSFAKFDRAKFTAALEKTLTTGSNPAPASLVTCFKQQFEKASDEQLKSVILSQNGAQQLFSACGG